MEKNCKYCGKRFTLNKHYHVIYCSRLCANKASAERRKRRIKIVCLNCKKEFEVTKGDLKYRKIIKYCSRECFYEHTKIKKIRCKYCKKEFKPLRKSSQFCSTDCVNKYKIGNKLSQNVIDNIKLGMAKPEVKDKLKVLNSRKRKPMTNKHKSKISDKLVGKMPKNAEKGTFKHIKSGKYDINGKIIYFRSKWEANYALYLDFLISHKEIKKWEYEVDIFIFDKIKFGTRSYKPDFKIINNNDTIEYHEVKGYMDARSKTKLKRMAKYYPEIKLRLIDKEVYNSIQKYSILLKFY